MQNESTWVPSNREWWVGIVNNSSIKDREENLRIGDLHRVDRENIVGENDQVGQLAGLNRSFDFFFEAGVCRTYRVSPDGFDYSNLLLWNPTIRMLAIECPAGDGGVDAHDRRHWRDIPIRPEGER